MVLNADLSFADWNNLRNLDGGMYGRSAHDPGAPENPVLTMAVPRLVTLGTGQHIYRWVDSRAAGSPMHKAAGPWWSTKRGAQAIVRRAAGGDTSGKARSFSNVARSWGSDLREVICARVTQPIRCFLGLGRAVYDASDREVWDGRGLQLYIPGLAAQDAYGKYALSADARLHLAICWVKQSNYVTMNDVALGTDV